jgi:hypothetical protein
MDKIEIIQTLEFTKIELEACYKKLGYTSSNVLKALDETIEAFSKPNVVVHERLVCDHNKIEIDLDYMGNTHYCGKCGLWNF